MGVYELYGFQGFVTYSVNSKRGTQPNERWHWSPEPLGFSGLRAALTPELLISFEQQVRDAGLLPRLISSHIYVYSCIQNCYA